MTQENEQTEVIARFSITDLDCDPEKMTERLRVQPTKIWRVGDERSKPGSGLIFENSGWRIESDLPRTKPVRDHVANLLQRMAPGWSALKQISAGYYIELALAITMRGGDRPELHFDAADIGKLAEVNAHIDVDLY